MTPDSLELLVFLSRVVCLTLTMERNAVDALGMLRLENNAREVSFFATLFLLT